MILKKIVEIVKKKYAFKTSEGALNWYRKKGVRIGQNTRAFAPQTIRIDCSRPELIEIGDHVWLHRGTNILTHDWAGWCFIESENEFYPSHEKVKIGDNVWLGENVTICKGVTIGNNCIIGIGSIVTKSIPANSVAVGVPARVIGTYEDYMNKRSQLYVEETVEYALAILDSGREPKVEDFWDDYPCFVDGSNYQDYPYPYMRVFKTKERFEKWKKNHKKVFKDFDDFIYYVKSKRKGL